MPHIPGHGISFADWFKNNPQMAGYTPPTGGLGVSVGGQQVVGGNRLDQEGLADAMNRVRAAMSRPSFLDYLGGR